MLSIGRIELSHTGGSCLFTSHAGASSFAGCCVNVILCLKMTNNSTKKAVSTMNERLWTFAQQLPSENKFQAVLKLQLMYVSSGYIWLRLVPCVLMALILFRRKSLKHERIQKSEHEKMCRKCHIPWSAGYFSVEIIPGCKRNRRQIDQLQSKGELTKQQQSLLEYLKTRVGRTAVSILFAHVC